MARKPNPPPVAAPLPSPETPDAFLAVAARVDATLAELALGTKVLLHYQKRKLKRGEGEWEVETAASGTVWVYTQPPSLAAAKLIREQNKGKAGAKETEAKATTILVQLALPGHSQAVDQYLASLPEEKLGKYAFDESTLTRIRARRA